MELGEYLLDKSLCALSKIALSYVSDQQQVRVLFCFAKSKMLLLEHQSAAEDLNNLTQVNPDLPEAYLLYGHCQWLMGHYENAKVAYMTAIRTSNI